MIRLLPNLLTLLGGALSLAAIGWLELSSWMGAVLLVLGWCCDLLDGFAARRLGVVTEFGAQLDWAIDVAVVHALLAFLGGAWWVVLGFAALQAITLRLEASGARRRVSGRSGLVAFVVGRQLGVLWL